jgi:tetratricopeptide (TPR) repeat protein
MSRHNLKTIVKSRFNSIFCLITFFTMGLSNIVFGQAAADKTEVIQMIERGQPKKAVEKMEKLAAANPTDASLFYYLGYSQIRNGEPQKALATFDKGIQLNDKEGLNYVGKGYLKLAEQKPAEAKPLFDKALELTKSKNAEMLNAIANAYINNKRGLPEAEKLLVKSKSVNGNDFLTLTLLGDAYLAVNNGGEAMNSYERASELNAKNGLPFYRMGMLFLRSKNYDEAEKAFNKAVTADPSFALAFKELGELYYAKKDGASAAKAQESYMSLIADPKVGRLQLAFYYFMAKNYVKANEIFEQLIAEPNPLPITYKFYAKSLSESGNPDKGIEMWEKYFEVAKPEEIQVADYNTAANFLLGLGKPATDSTAVDYMGRSLNMDSTQTNIRQSKAETLMKRKRYAEAATDYKRLTYLRSKPFAADYYGLGRAYYYSDQIIPADSAFNMLIRLQPTRTVGPLWVARVRSKQDPESTQGLAKPYFEKVIELGSGDVTRNKLDLLDAYRYLGYYYYLKNDKEASIANWKKVLELAPNDPQATEAIDLLTKPKAQPQTKKP